MERKPESLYLKSGDEELATWPNYNLLLQAIFSPIMMERIKKINQAKMNYRNKHRVNKERGIRNLTGNPADRRDYFKTYYKRVTKHDKERIERRKARANQYYEDTKKH